MSARLALQPGRPFDSAVGGLLTTLLTNRVDARRAYRGSACRMWLPVNSRIKAGDYGEQPEDERKRP